MPCDAPPGSVILDDAYPLGLQEDGTWSLAGSFWHRLPLQEDNSQTRSLLKTQVPNKALLKALNAELRQQVPDQFGEADATYRYYDEWLHLYSKSDLLGRFRSGDGATAGARELLRYDPDWTPLVFFLEGSAYVQQPSGAIFPGQERVEGSALLRAWVTEYREITPMLGHEPDVLLFGRLMSRDHVAYLPGRIDEDIFTTYKAEHRGGLEAGDTLICRPFLDTKCWGGVAATTDEEFRYVDHVTARTGWAQLAGDVEFHIEYEGIAFFKNEDRQHSLTKHLLDLGLTADLWPCHHNRAQVGIDWLYDYRINRYNLTAFLAWHFGAGRRYRDFRPDEVNFLDLRRRRAAEMLDNNRLWLAE